MRNWFKKVRQWARFEGTEEYLAWTRTAAYITHLRETEHLVYA